MSQNFKTGAFKLRFHLVYWTNMKWLLMVLYEEQLRTHRAIKLYKFRGRLHGAFSTPGLNSALLTGLKFQPVCNTKLYTKIKRAITWKNVQPRAEFNPGVEISTLLQLVIHEQKWRLFYFWESMPRTNSISTPGGEIVHVIAKNLNPINRAEFNPGV